MAETDPVTGLPISQIEKKSNVERFNRLTEQKAKSDQLAEDIGTEKGQLVLHKIQEHLLAGLNEFIDADPSKLVSIQAKCKTLKGLLVDMGVTISVGDMAVERLMRLVMKKQTP